VKYALLAAVLVALVAAFAPGEGTGLVRSIIYGFGWGVGREIAHGVFGHRRW